MYCIEKNILVDILNTLNILSLASHWSICTCPSNLACDFTALTFPSPLNWKQKSNERKQSKETISLCKPLNQPKNYFYDTNKTKNELNRSLTHQQIHGVSVRECVWVKEGEREREGFEKETLSILNIEFNAYFWYLCWPIDRNLCFYMCVRLLGRATFCKSNHWFYDLIFWFENHLN